MLQRIRDNASGPIAYAVVGLITLVFGVWGIGSYFTPSADPVVASVGKTKITRYQLQQAYNNAYDQRYQQLKNRFGSDFDSDLIKPDQLRHMALQRLIRQATIDQYALDAGYRTTDQMLLQVLQQDPRFQRDGKFSTKRYKAMLANAGLDPATFEARLRRNLVSSQVRSGVASGAFNVSPAVDHAWDLLNQQRRIAWLAFPAKAYTDQVQVDDDEIEDWYHQRSDQYMQPERVKLAYVELDRDALEPDDAITKDQLETLYKQHKREFSTPDKRDIEQLFVPVKQGEAAQARQTIQSIAAAVADGKSFDEVASDHDGVQVTKRADVTRGSLPEALARAVFEQDKADVSRPVRVSDKGWYLVRTTAIHPGETTPFDAPEVQKKLKAMALEQWRNKTFSARADDMSTLAYQAPNSLDTVSDKLDLKVRKTGWLSRDQGEGVARNDAVRKAAFSGDVLDEGLNSTAIQIADGKRIVLRIADHEAPEQKPLDEVRETIRKQLVTRKAQKLAHQAAEAARDKVAKGTSLQQIAEQTPATLNKPGYIERRSNDLPTAVRRSAFSMPAPQADQPSLSVTTTDKGEAALVALEEIKKAGSDDNQVSPAFKRRQRMYVAQLEYAAFVGYLSRHADVTVNQDKIDREQ